MEIGFEVVVSYIGMELVVVNVYEVVVDIELEAVVVVEENFWVAARET